MVQRGAWGSKQPLKIVSKGVGSHLICWCMVQMSLGRFDVTRGRDVHVGARMLQLLPARNESFTRDTTYFDLTIRNEVGVYAFDVMSLLQIYVR